MKTTLFALLLSAAPAFAEDGRADMAEGFSLLDRGADLLLRGVMSEMEMQLRDLATEIGPALRQLTELLRELDAYQAPHILPNGDIILRRKVPLLPGQGDEIDL